MTCTNLTDTAAARILERINFLAGHSETPSGLTRRYLTPEHAAANQTVAQWMKEAGMAVETDSVGNVIGRYEGLRPELGSILVGSHLDSVPDGGRFDGTLGVITAIECVRQLYQTGRKLRHSVEIIGFGDEEGARFHTAFLGSRGFIGDLDPEVLKICDDKGTSLAQAMGQFQLDPTQINQNPKVPGDIACYLELHIEQGPVLQHHDLPVGIVSAIYGQTRAKIQLTGQTEHAGTVPMAVRRDALAGAAQTVLEIEAICNSYSDVGVLGTVGQIIPHPGASNVIAGSCSLTLDLRAPDDDNRQRVLETIEKRLEKLASQRGLQSSLTVVYNNEAVQCTPRLTKLISEAVSTLGVQPLSLGSGAGHDAVIMSSITDVGMIFVRCRDGISHSPDEFVSVEDLEAGFRLLQTTLELVSQSSR
ncbi:MAG: allantoate amidohydrolase [Gammaproteobacteria bacterium]|nr:allantoate amidohydrolase [Gammaproteobacteria bacterium]